MPVNGEGNWGQGANLIELAVIRQFPRRPRSSDSVSPRLLPCDGANTLSPFPDRVDYLSGFKENVIMGHLIPAGTGFYHHREAEFEFTVEEPEPIVVPKETFEDDEDAATA